MAQRCPLTNTPFWRELSSQVGEDKAWRLFAEWGQKFDEVATVDELLKAPFSKPILEENSDKILSVIDNQIKALENQINKLRRSKNNSNSSYNQSKINDIQKTIKETLERKESLEYSRSVSALVNGALSDLQEMDEFVSDKSNRANPNYIARLHQYKAFIEDHSKIAIPSYSYGRKIFINNANEASSLITKLTREIREELENHVLENVADRTSNKKLIENPEELAGLMKEATDISWIDANLLDIHTTPDTLIANFGKIFKEKLQIVFKRTDEFTKKLTAAGNKLAKLNGGKIDHSFMIDGGNYIKQQSKEYISRNNEIVNQGKNKDGSPMEYYKIIDPTKASKGQLEHNMRLQAIKQEIREWKAAETISEEGQVSDGENHKYTDSFKEARNQFEELVDTGTFWKWVKKEGVDEEAYAKYRSDYYQEPVAMWVAARDENGPTGAVYLVTQSFVKNEFTEVTSKWENEKFKTLQTDNTPYGNAKREFYNLFVDEFENGSLSKLGISQKRRMIGRLPVVKAANIDQLSNKGENFFKVTARAVRNYFVPDTYTSARLTDGNGFTAQDIPIFYVGGLKDQAKIEKLLEERRTLSVADPEYKTKFEELSNQIAQETKRLDEGALETDLVKSLIKFRAMAENFEVQKELEATALAFKSVIDSRTYIKGGEKIAGVASNTAKRFNNFLNFQLYQSNEQDNSVIATVAKKLQQLTSLQGVAFAPLSSVNNYVLGRLSQKIEAVSGQYVTPKSYNEAGREYHTQYMPNIVKEFIKEGDGPYKDTRSHSKYSALVKKFNFMANFHETGGLNTLAFGLSQGGEFANITRLGIAYIRDYKVKNSSGEEMSLYDAFDYDPNTGEVTLKKGVKFTDREQFDLANKIQQVAGLIHGKYSADEKSVLQNYWVGQLAFQFKKWIVPNYKARFASRGSYANEATGVENEGRWLSAWNFLVRIKQFNGDFKLAYSQADAIEKANLLKTQYEIGFFIMSFVAYSVFKHIKDGLPEDDENLRALLGLVESQSKRQAAELSAFVNPQEYLRVIKNPLPITKTIDQGLEIIANGVALPFQMSSDSPGAYFNSGKNKDQLKFLVNVKNFAPGFRQVGRINDLSEEQDWFK
jgi:hypothetical protein